VRRARSKRVFAITIAAVAVAIAGAVPAAGSDDHPPGAPTMLTVDDDAAPLAVEGPPKFGWRVTDADRNETQTAYEIVVTAGTRTLFDTKKVVSSQQAYVTLPGLRLRPDTSYRWTVRTWDGAGIAGPYAAPAAFDTGLGDRDWNASWIRRSDSETGTEDDFSLFRTGFTPAAAPITRARVYASAGQQYELFVNGERLAHGPSFSYPDEQYYEATDITRALHAGRPNVVAFVTHWSTPGQGRPASVPALIAHITIDHNDGPRETITTDPSWKTHPGPWIQGQRRNGEGDFVEHIDERLALPNWTTSQDDAGWSPAVSLGAHPIAQFPHLLAARTHIAFQPLPPVSLRRLADGNYVADFGAVFAATPVVQVRHGAAGRPVELIGGYVLDPDGHVSTTTAIQETNMRWDFDERTGAQELRPFGYLGFRYLEVDGAHEPLTAAVIRIAARHAAMPDEHAAAFATSNETLNAVWNLARHSALYDSQEQFLDTPTREKGPFLGDGFDVSQATEAAFGERALTFQALRDFARSQNRYWPDGRVNVVYPNGDGKRDIPDGTETYVQWVWHNYEITGNKAQLAALFPAVNNVVKSIARAIDGKTGLVTNLPGGGEDYLHGAVDWPPAMRYGYDMDTVARTTMNILAADDFDRVDDMAAILHRGREVKTSAQRLRAAITANLVRTDGIFIDGLKADGSRSTHASQQANAYALAFGLVPDEDVPAVERYVASLGTNMGVVNFRVLLDALTDDALVTELTDSVRPGYAQILQKGATFTWESWNAREVGDSESHGWGSTVLAVLQDRILGVRIADPGAARVDVTVPDSSLTYAKGVVATQRGPIAVAWTRDRAHTTLDIRIPPNVVARLPGSDNTLGSGHYVLHDYEPVANSNTGASWLPVGLITLVIAGALGGVLLMLRRGHA
jgi:alpha-L-rhamnosidase